MVLVSQSNPTTTGFLDGISNHLAALSLGLTKGTNLFVEFFLDDPSSLTDQLVLSDEGYETITAFHLRMTWDVKLSTSRTTQHAAQEALRTYVNALINDVRFTATSDNGENFLILTTRVVTSPDVIDKLDSGRYLAESTLQFEVIPL